MEQETADLGLSKPGKELAAYIIRELSWEERIDGSVFDPGPGEETHRVFRLEALSNLLGSMANFSVDFDILQRWTGEILGDSEMSDAIGKVLGEVGHGTDEARDRIVAILEVRLAQCAEVLSEDGVGDGAATVGTA